MYLNHIKERELVMKLGEVLCRRFFVVILGVESAQNLAKYNIWLRVLMQLTNRNIVITKFVHIV